MNNLLLIIKGAFIGIGGILPGVSGGVLCAMFGLYQPIIEVLSDPFKNLKKHIRLIIPVGTGVVIGFIGFAGMVNAFMKANATVAICVFVGLIVGMLPDMWRDAGREGRSKGDLGAMAASMVLFLILLWYLQNGMALTVVPNTGWYIFCGVAWGLSIIVPGLSSSSMLIFFGLYQPMLEGLSTLNMSVVIPLIIGGAGVVFTLSKALNYFFSTYYSLANHIIFGIVIANTLMIIPTDLSGAGAVLAAAVSIILGAAGGICLNKLFAVIAKTKNK